MTHLFQFDVCGFAKETLILFHLDNNIYLKLWAKNMYLYR